MGYDVAHLKGCVEAMGYDFAHLKACNLSVHLFSYKIPFFKGDVCSSPSEEPQIENCRRRMHPDLDMLSLTAGTTRAAIEVLILYLFYDKGIY